LRGKFLKTDVAVQEVGPRYLARGLEQWHWLGWLPCMGKRPAVWPLTIQPMTLQNEVP
jgi:hypothetical protein